MDLFNRVDGLCNEISFFFKTSIVLLTLWADELSCKNKSSFCRFSHYFFFFSASLIGNACLMNILHWLFGSSEECCNQNDFLMKKINEKWPWLFLLIFWISLAVDNPNAATAWTIVWSPDPHQNSHVLSPVTSHSKILSLDCWKFSTFVSSLPSTTLAPPWLTASTYSTGYISSVSAVILLTEICWLTKIR